MYRFKLSVRPGRQSACRLRRMEKCWPDSRPAFRAGTERISGTTPELGLGKKVKKAEQKAVVQKETTGAVPVQELTKEELRR